MLPPATLPLLLLLLRFPLLCFLLLDTRLPLSPPHTLLLLVVSWHGAHVCVHVAGVGVAGAVEAVLLHVVHRLLLHWVSWCWCWFGADVALIVLWDRLVFLFV